MAAFGLRYPIFCAGFGLAATPELAIAVSNGGGLGALGTGSTASADMVRERVSRTKSGTSRPFAVNYLLAFDPLTLPVALDAGGIGLFSNEVVRDPGYHVLGVNMLDRNDVDVCHQPIDQGQPITGVRIHGLNGNTPPEGNVQAEPGTLFELYDCD